MLPVPLNSSKITSSMRLLRLDERGGEDGEAAAFLGIARGAEEFLRLDQRLGIDAAGHDAAFVRLQVVVAARKAGDGIEQDDDVLAELDEALGAVAHQLGELGVALRAFVEGGGADLAAGERAFEVGDLLRALIDEQQDECGLRRIDADGLGDLLEHDRLARARRGDDEAALAAAERRDEIDGARGDRAGLGILQHDALGGMERGELFELGGLLPLVGRDALDVQDAVDGHETLAVARRADARGEPVAIAEEELALHVRPGRRRPAGASGN